jgi:hypothetical protein
MRLLTACVSLSLILASCRTPDVVWNADGKSMTDLVDLRLRAGRSSVELTPGVTLWADSIQYGDKRRLQGEAEGQVYLEVMPAARGSWMVEHGYAGKAAFHRGSRWLVLGSTPILERGHTTQIGTEDYTEIEIRWRPLASEIIVRGPTRIDFGKSHPVPPGVPITLDPGVVALRNPVVTELPPSTFKN